MTRVSFITRFLNRRFYYFLIILLIKSIVARDVVFGNGFSWLTLLTEIPFIVAVFCLIEFFAGKRKMLYYLIVNLLFTVLYFSILMYYKYYGIIVTADALTQADKVTQVGESTYSLMDPYYLLIFLDIIVIAVVLLLPRYKKARQSADMRPRKSKLWMAAFALSITVCLVNVWPNRASMNENKQAEEMGLLDYEVYNIVDKMMEDEALTPMNQITQAKINELKGITEPAAPKYFGAGKGKNVIILQMESYQDFLIGLKVGGVEITPNMNKLVQETAHYKNFYTMVGQGTTSDAEYVVNTSLYVPKHKAATDVNVDKALPSLPKLMKESGYATATFHTNSVDFWNRKELYSAIGWDKYYDQAFYGDEDHVAFGASDEVLYKKTLPELVKMDQADKPFYAQVISMSAHHPYNIPTSKYRIELPAEFKDDSLVTRYLKAQNYADYALGEFIDGLKSSGLWDDSIVLMYGDHQGLPLYSLDDDEKALMKEMLGTDYGHTEMFNIPLIMHVPGVTHASVIDQVGGQIDILPTVANLVGASLQNQIHFGEDLLNQSSELIPMRHFLPSGSVIDNTNLYIPGIEYQDGTNHKVSDGKETKEGGVTEDEYNRALELLHLSDSYVQQLPHK
ncbi:LTA synthase family protein [Paenibacillus glycanilyticus]|uniref:LTA synthase family protein n=1 Tax=Paenibacillus glycanilyticus TaxID=126569 RepID=UPI00203A892F|nr:LTA synthase family protein [Paenibacillus glycanilyticus]MCM3627878.1 LTA synthase family protein [Paenibacillus glycanilyticus]